MKNLIYLFFFLSTACSDNSNISVKAIQPEEHDTILTAKKSDIISDSTNILEKGSQKLELEFIGWRCLCPNWITTSDRLKYQGKGLESDPAKYCFYIEPSTGKLALPDSFNLSKHNIVVTGKFITNNGLPEGHDESEENARPAKVFRYTDFKIIAKKNAPY